MATPLLSPPPLFSSSSSPDALPLLVRAAPSTLLPPLLANKSEERSSGTKRARRASDDDDEAEDDEDEQCARARYEKHVRLLFDDVRADGSSAADEESSAVVAVPSSSSSAAAVIVLSRVDNDDDEDDDAGPVERFERAQARLLCAAPYVAPPLPVVRQARTELGYHPLVAASAGWPWNRTEREGWGGYAYGVVRARLELEYARVAQGQGVLRFAADPELGGGVVVATVLTEPQARRALRGVLYMRRDGPDKDLAVASIADVWLHRDPDARTYAEVVFDPRQPPGDLRCPRTGALRWNTWPGIRAARLPPPPSAAAADEGVALVYEHIRDVVCDGRDDHAAWLLDYFAAIVQRPWRRTGVAVLLTGLQGAGKNTVVDFFRTRVLGARITSHAQDLNLALLGRFAENQAATVFEQYDELLARNQRQIDALKHRITSDTVRYERKFQDPVVRPNYANLFATTNTSDGGLGLTPDDRRWALLKVSGRRIGDHAYFARLHAACGDDAVARAFYDALMARDITRAFGPLDSNANGQAARPITAHHRACVRAAIAPARRFLCALIHARAYTLIQGAPASVLAADLYRDYCHFVADARLAPGPENFYAFGDALAQLMLARAAAPAPSSSAEEAQQQKEGEKTDKTGRKRRRQHNDEDAAPRIDQDGAALERRRCNQGFYYRFDYARLRALLLAIGEYDPAAFPLRPLSAGRA
jgi:hypothetical protein